MLNYCFKQTRNWRNEKEIDDQAVATVSKSTIGKLISAVYYSRTVQTLALRVNTNLHDEIFGVTRGQQVPNNHNQRRKSLRNGGFYWKNLQVAIKIRTKKIVKIWLITYFNFYWNHVSSDCFAWLANKSAIVEVAHGYFHESRRLIEI